MYNIYINNINMSLLLALIINKKFAKNKASFFKVLNKTL